MAKFVNMAPNEYISSPLNDQQVLMLRLLRKPLPEEDFTQMRRLAVKLLAKQLDESVDKWEKDNNVTEETYERLINDHFRASSSKRPE